MKYLAFVTWSALLFPAFPQGPAKAEATQSASAPNVFGSIALPISSSRYDARWTKANRSNNPPILRTMFEPARYRSSVQQLAYVNATLNQRIRYRFDNHPSGDHWASAQETMGKLAGDCEDIAIAKLQALRMLGIPGDRLYVTIGNEASGSVHAVLVVRDGASFWVLDNRSDRLIPHREYRRFYPILTFSNNRTWIHGYERGATPPAVRALDAKRTMQIANLRVGDSPASAARVASFKR